MTVWIENKYNQQLVEKDRTIIYQYKDVKIGMTKKQVKLAIGWRNPTKINSSAYSEQWCYDDDGDGFSDYYLYFDSRGRVSNWQIFN